MAQEIWKNNKRPVKCLPLCIEAHWVLVVVVQTASTPVILHLNSRESDIGEKIAAVIASYFRSAIVENIKVPVQKKMTTLAAGYT